MLRRRSYQTGAAADTGFFPLADQVQLLPTAWSPWLVEAVVRLGTWLPFARVPEALAFFARVRISRETARRGTETAGGAPR